MRSIWAVARNTIRQAIRMKIAAAFIVLLLVIIPIMGLTITGDDTIKGRLQSFLAYSMALVSLLLSLLTIIVAAFTLSDDIRKKRIYTVITKPIRRFELLLGKSLGVIILDLLILIPIAVIIYSVTIYLPHFYKADPEQTEMLNNEFFTARASLTTPPPDVRKEVNILYEKLKQNQQLPKNMSYQQIISNLTHIKKNEKRAVPVGAQLRWDFENVRVSGQKQKIFIRFKYDVSINPPDLNVYGLWVVGDLREITPVRTGPGKTYFIERKDLIRTIQEIEIPADAIAADGYLGIAFINNPLNDTVVIFPTKDGFELLYKADNFTANYIKAVLLVLVRLIFLASLATFAATFLSFPVTILLCFAVFFAATMHGFIMESFGDLSKEVGLVYNYTVKPLVQLIPRFDYYTPSKYLVPARLISYGLIAKIITFMLLIKSGLLFGLAMLIFKFKEIAKITV